MKKLIVFFSLILFCAIFSQQCISQIDLVVGLVKSSITGGESWKDPLGIQAGVIVPVANFNKSLSLRVEGNISMQGAKWEDFGYKGRFNLLYFNVPVVLRYQTESGFFGEAGIQPGLLISAKDKYEGTSYDAMDDMNKLDISIPVEIGYLLNEKIAVGIRVIPGVNDITKDEDEADRNLVFALRGTYRFTIKK
jgi:hypothetical protein